MGLTRAELETVINMSDADTTARIYTYQRSMIRKLKANPEAKLLTEGEFEGHQWAEFSIPARLLTIRRTRVLNPEQRAAATARLQSLARTRAEASAVWLCAKCDGTGKRGYSPCGRCGGTGKVQP